MEQELKEKLFAEVLRLETLAGKKTYDGRDYCEQSEGAYSMLTIMGIGIEYIRWAYGKTWEHGEIVEEKKVG